MDPRHPQAVFMGLWRISEERQPGQGWKTSAWRHGYLEITQRVARGRRMKDTNPTRLYAWKGVVSLLQAAYLFLTSLSSFLLPPVSKANPVAGWRTYSGSNPPQGSTKASAVTSSHLLQFFTLHAWGFLFVCFVLSFKMFHRWCIMCLFSLFWV